MSKKATGIVAYISLLGWLIAFMAGDKEGARFHLNQALIVDVALVLCSALTRVPVVGIVFSLLSLFFVVCWVLGLIHAIKEEEKQIPLVGGIQILK